MLKNDSVIKTDRTRKKFRKEIIERFDEEIALRDMALGIYEADDEDDLIEIITDGAGYCIKSIDYDILSK